MLPLLPYHSTDELFLTVVALQLHHINLLMNNLGKDFLRLKCLVLSAQFFLSVSFFSIILLYYVSPKKDIYVM